MRFIQQLTETINPQLSDIVSSVSSDNMLEQFYAIYIMRLCDKALLAQLSVMTDTTNLLEKVWSQKSHRDMICHELSISHHLEEEMTLQLISQASPLVYQHVAQQANTDGVTIFDFLQSHIGDIKTLFPIWIDSVISRAILSGEPQADVEAPMPSAPIEENNECAEITPPEPTPTPSVNPENLDDVENKEQPVYTNLPRGKKRVRGKKTKSPRRKKPATPQDKARIKKILIIAIPLIVLNLIIVIAWLWFKKTSDAQANEPAEVVLTQQQDPNNQDYPIPPAQPIEPNNQDMATPPQQPQQMGIPPQQPQQANGQNIAVPPAQPQQPINQNVGVPPQQPQQPINQNMVVPPAQPPQANYQNMVPPAQPQQPMMDMPPPNVQMNMQQPPPQQMPAYEPPVVNNPPPQQSMSISQSPNEMVFEFNNNDNGGITEEQLDELTNVEIIAEELENETQ